MTRFERRAFVCLVEHAVAPASPLPPVRDTEAVAAFERYLHACPPANRLGLRAAIVAIECAPIVTGPERRRLSSLESAARDGLLGRLLEGRLAPLLTALRGLAQLSYYGDRGVVGSLGYDAAAVVDRGRALRASEGRW